jgi:catechol 2,3-dioxygenase-like lactoylglutathione lyase family enzyme
MNDRNRHELAASGWRGFHHLALVTRDLDQTIAFYENVLGMKAGPVYPARGGRGRHCFIHPGGAETKGLHFFEYPEAEIFQSADAIRRLQRDPRSADINRFLPGALQHIAFAAASEEEALALRSRLLELDIPVTEVYDLGEFKDYIFTDNNGIQIEVAWEKNVP